MCLPTKGSNRVLLTISDSIAIKILNNDTILRGVGNELHLHSICCCESSKVLNIRLKGKIHGIEKSTDLHGQILVYGEKEFVLLEWDGEHCFYEHYRAKLTDWISAAKFLEDGTGFVILTAHSVLLRFSYSVKEEVKEKCAIMERISCADKSTLYCAHLHGKNLQDLVVFGGNAFGELLIWQPFGKTIKNGNEVPLLSRMTVHNGVIFSIDYEPKEKILTTTSDDRSISFWRVENEKGWFEANIKPIASGFGHQARVFQGRIINYDNNTYAITVGEDSYFCLWHCNGELIYKKRIQFGAVIWNVAYAENTGTIYTVGSTGNMISYNLRNILEENQNHIAKKLAPPNPLSEAEYIAKIKFLTKWQLIGLTNQNHLVINDLRSDSWHVVKAFAGYKCTVLEVYESNLIALCGYKRFTLLDHSDGIVQELYDGEVLSGIIRSFHFLNEMQFLLSDELGNCVLLERKRLHQTHSIELPKCKERWLTAALLITQELLLVSNRLGNIMLYQFNIKCSSFELRDILKHPHGYLGATLLKLIELDGCLAYVLSAGHDGTLKTLCVNSEKAAVTVTNHQVVPVAWIEKSIALDATEVFLGFNDNHFTAWTSDHDITLQVSCGGGHRCWHFCIYSDESKGLRIKLVFIKNKNVLLHDLQLFQQLQEDMILPHRNRWHTRPCNVLEILKQRVGEELISISAGDDNLIKVATLSCDNSKLQFHQKAEIHTHISNIRALKVLLTSSSECLVFSVGGRAQLCVTAIDLSNFRVTELLNYMLKATTNNSPSTQTHSFDPETRIMSIDVLVLNASANIVYLACSDGFLRKLHVDSNYNVSLDKEVYYGKCLLQVRLIADLYLLIAATDGILTFFSLDLKTIYMKLPLHASGINALDVNYKSTERKLHLLTGGDDQAVVYTQLCLKDLEKPLLLEKLHLSQLHTAQVTGARFSKCGRYMLTSGVDQNIIRFDLEKREVVCVTHSCVADVKGLNLDFENEMCLLYGCGLQIFEKYS